MRNCGFALAVSSIVIVLSGGSLSQAEHRDPPVATTYLKVVDASASGLPSQSNSRHIVACVLYGGTRIYDREAEVQWTIKKDGSTVFRMTTTGVSLFPGQENCIPLGYGVRESHGPGRYQIYGTILIPVAGLGMTGMGGADRVTIDLP